MAPASLSKGAGFKTTPAIAAGLADGVWTVEEMIQVVTSKSHSAGPAGIQTGGSECLTAWIKWISSLLSNSSTYHMKKIWSSGLTVPVPVPRTGTPPGQSVCQDDRM